MIMIISDVLDLYIAVIKSFSEYDFLLSCFAVLCFVFITSLVIFLLSIWKGGSV